MTFKQIYQFINPKKELWRWGPIDGRPIFPEFWYGGMFSFNKRFPPGWCSHMEYLYHEKFLVITDYREIYDKGELIFKRYILNDRQFKKNYSAWLEMIGKFKSFYRSVISTDLKALSDSQLLALFRNFVQLFSHDFWSIGSLPETANWGGEQILKRELEKKLSKPEAFNLAFEKLAAPENYSFYQIEELDLLKIRLNSKNLEKHLKNHQQKYFWLLNSYHHTQVLPVSYFQKILNKYSQQKAKNKIKKILDFKKLSKSGKEKIVKKYNLSPVIFKMAKRLAFCVWWQDSRKQYIFQANHLIRLFLKELNRRYKVDYEKLHYYRILDLVKLIQTGKPLSAKELKKRDFFYVCFIPKYGLKYYFGNQAKKIMKPYLVKRKIKTEELKGLVVSSGKKVIGQVKIIHSPKEVSKMKPGDILVAAMTSPDYIVALRKASAIITDEGGMTCHAAIVSRELKIPCIVGTKYATKVFRDGDLVEVDANKGVVRKI